jgi:hypothetical protein
MRTHSFLTLLALTAALSACDRKPKAEPAAAAPTGWQMSADKATWAPVELPSTAWGCNDCDRYFKTTIRDVPKSVKFRFASDNKARMMVNGTEAFADFWKDRFCTDKPCCARCCDTGPTCKKHVADGPAYELSAAALKAFHPGDNEVVWEVHQEVGSSGFHVEMDVGR